MCKKQNFNTSTFVDFTVQTWITLEKKTYYSYKTPFEHVAPFHSYWMVQTAMCCNSLDICTWFITQTHGRVCCTWHTVGELLPKCGTNLPKSNCVHRIIGFTRNVHLTTQAQHIMYPTITQRVIFLGSHHTSQCWHTRLHHEILQTNSALIKWPGWLVNPAEATHNI